MISALLLHPAPQLSRDSPFAARSPVRIRIPRAASLPAHHRFVGILDLPVGGSLTLYGRTFHIVGCDPFTRAFLEREGLEVAPDTPYPETAEEHAAAAAAAAKALKPRRNDSAVERGDKARQWFSLDRKVLRFFCTLDQPPAAPGAPVERRAYVLHFFLADNSVEILEVVEKNSGRDPFPKLLSRQPLPKSAVGVGIKPMGQESRRQLNIEYVRPVDLRIGGTVNVFGACGARRRALSMPRHATCALGTAQQRLIVCAGRTHASLPAESTNHSTPLRPAPPSGQPQAAASSSATATSSLGSTSWKSSG